MESFNASMPFAQLKNGDCLVVYLRRVSHPVLLVKQAFTNKDGSQGTLYLVSSDMTLTSERMTALYQKQWKVEEYHKSVKQNASLAKSPTKIIATQANHFYVAILVFIKLEKLKVKTQLGHFQLKTKPYFAELKAMDAYLAKLSA